jgi:hypothetical protein
MLSRDVVQWGKQLEKIERSLTNVSRTLVELKAGRIVGRVVAKS